jgi:hypothetical protein
MTTRLATYLLLMSTSSAMAGTSEGYGQSGEIDQSCSKPFGTG